MIISLIAAVDEKGGIGKNNRLPWRLPSDLKRFKKLTMGHCLIMGRKTYETIGTPLTGRIMIIVTRQKLYSPPGCEVAHSLAEALKAAENHQESEVFVIGGGEIFRQTIALADKIYMTTVHADVNADVKFPRLNPDHWISNKYESSPQNDQDEYRSEFEVLQRKSWD